MKLFTLIIALVKSGLPFPDLKSEEEVKGWIVENADEMAALVAYFASKTDVAEAEDELAEVLASAELAEKIGDGKILEFLQKMLPVVIQLLPVILPLFLDDGDKPQPVPTPNLI